MEKPDNSVMLQLIGQIAQNGVGFRSLFFRMNLSVDSFFDTKGEVRKEFTKLLEIRFSDGEKLLGTFEINREMLNKMCTDCCTSATKDEYSIHLQKVEQFLPVEGVKEISIELFFNAIKGLYGNTAGYALIDVGHF
ncbi:MAG: hypothetical protein WCG55_02025 [bacterium]